VPNPSDAAHAGRPEAPDTASDLALVRDALAGDAASFHKLFDLYLPPVVAFARRERASDAEALALAGRILEALFAHLGGYAGRTPLSAWVLAVARCVAREGAPRQG